MRFCTRANSKAIILLASWAVISYTIIHIYLEPTHINELFLSTATNELSANVPFKDSSSTISADINALAIVFPQYHRIPENDRFFGVNFTEWTLLKPHPRQVHNENIKKPIADLGYILLYHSFD